MKKHLLILLLIGIYPIASSQISEPRAWAEFEETRGIIVNQPNTWKRITLDKPEWVFQQAEEVDSVYIKLIQEALLQEIDIYYILSTLNTIDDFSPIILDTMINRYGINPDHPNFHVIEVDRSIYMPGQWVRDHGPMNVYENGVEKLYNVLFADDISGAGKIVSEYLEIPTYEIADELTGGFASDGGNFMVDGNKFAIIDEGRVEEPAQLPAYASLFGLESVYTVPNYLHHIDYFMKLVNEETLLVSEQLPSNYTTGYENYSFEEDSSYLHNAISYIQSNAISCNGRPYKIVRIPNAPSFNLTAINLTYMTADASYINSLIVNNAVFVPQFSNPETDTLAITIYKNTMPGYKIIPVASRVIAQGSGAVHCVTNSIAADEPIWIRHSWMPDSLNQTEDYEISATIKTKSGIKDAALFWTADLNTAFNEVSMENTGGDRFKGVIPGQPYGTHLHYYIEAEANSGKKGSKPLVAPDWAYNFRVQANGANPAYVLKNVSESSIAVFPNPVIDIVRFDLSGFSSDRCELTIYDLWGKTVDTRYVSSSLEINTSDYPAGYYLYMIKDPRNGVYTNGRFIKL